MSRQRVQRPPTSCLSLLEVNRWIYGPRAGLESLLLLGRIEVEDLRLLSNLMYLIGYLPGEATDDLDPSVVGALITKIHDGDAVEQDEVEAAQEWVERCAVRLRKTLFTDYRDAMTRLVAAVEARDEATHSVA